METGTGLHRGLRAVVENGAHVINMSYGEPTGRPGYGRFMQMAQEVALFYNVVFVASAGNNGPALTTVGAPGGASPYIISVGAAITQSMMEDQYALRKLHAATSRPAGLQGQQSRAAAVAGGQAQKKLPAAGRTPLLTAGTSAGAGLIPSLNLSAGIISEAASEALTSLAGQRGDSGDVGAAGGSGGAESGPGAGQEGEETQAEEALSAPQPSGVAPAPKPQQRQQPGGPAAAADPSGESSWQEYHGRALDTNYTWSSRGPAADGSLGVSICAPGGAITCVPRWNLFMNALMNGTSMSSPNAAGCIALVLSALKQLHVPYTSMGVKRAVENTAAAVAGSSEIFGTGHGMIQVLGAFHHLLLQDALLRLKSAAFHKSSDLHAVSRIREPIVQAAVAYGGANAGAAEDQGIYLRDAPQSAVARDFTVSITPNWYVRGPTGQFDQQRQHAMQGSTGALVGQTAAAGAVGAAAGAVSPPSMALAPADDVQENLNRFKVAYQLRLALVSTAPDWISLPSHLLLGTTPRTFVAHVDPRGLTPGQAHYAEILGYEVLEEAVGEMAHGAGAAGAGTAAAGGATESKEGEAAGRAGAVLRAAPSTASPSSAAQAEAAAVRMLSGTGGLPSTPDILLDLARTRGSSHSSNAAAGGAGAGAAATGAGAAEGRAVSFPHLHGHQQFLQDQQQQGRLTAGGRAGIAAGGALASKLSGSPATLPDNRHLAQGSSWTFPAGHRTPPGIGAISAALGPIFRVPVTVIIPHEAESSARGVTYTIGTPTSLRAPFSSMTAAEREMALIGRPVTASAIAKHQAAGGTPAAGGAAAALSRQELSFTGPLSLRPGLIHRRFINVPEGATWAEVHIRRVDDGSPAAPEAVSTAMTVAAPVSEFSIGLRPASTRTGGAAGGAAAAAAAASDDASPQRAPRSSPVIIEELEASTERPSTAATRRHSGQQLQNRHAESQYGPAAAASSGASSSTTVESSPSNGGYESDKERESPAEHGQGAAAAGEASSSAMIVRPPMHAAAKERERRGSNANGHSYHAGTHQRSGSGPAAAGGAGEELTTAGRGGQQRGKAATGGAAGAEGRAEAGEGEGDGAQQEGSTNGYELIQHFHNGPLHLANPGSAAQTALAAAAASGSAVTVHRPLAGPLLDSSAGKRVVDPSPRTIVIHAVQTVREVSMKQTSHENYYYLRPYDSDVLVLPVQAGSTLEVDIAQFW